MFNIDITYFGQGVGVVILGYVVGIAISIIYSIISRLGDV